MKPPKIAGHHWGWQGPFGRDLYDNRDGRVVASVISSFFGFGSASGYVFKNGGHSERWENVSQAYNWIAYLLEPAPALEHGLYNSISAKGKKLA